MLVSIAAILNDDGPPVPDEDKAIFYAAAELGVRYLSLDLQTKFLLIARSGGDSPTHLTPSTDEILPHA
jgi:hypothetical protein